MVDPRHSRITTLAHDGNVFNAPMQDSFSFPTDVSYTSPVSNNPTALDSTFDVNMAHGLPSQPSIQDMAAMPGMVMPNTHRGSLGDVGTQTLHQQPRTSSIGGSEAWSPSSSRQGQNTSDENLTAQSGTKGTAGKPDRYINEPDHDDEDGEKPPPWSELKTKAGKERKRLPLACIACRRKKIRCSGEKPACKHCLRSRIPCVYKVTTRKAAPRTDYMAMLDKRLKRMEERVIKVVPKEELPETSSIARAVVKPALPGSMPKSAKPPMTKKRSADEAFMIELNQWTQPLAHRPLAEGSNASRQAKGERENTLLTEGAEYLPPMDIQEHLSEVFFDCVYGQSYLLLHKPSFMRRLANGNIPPVLMLAICAISARFSTHPSLNTSPNFLRGESWASPARAIVERRHFEPNITILTVMLILGLHYFGTCEGGLSWSFGGQAMRMAYALQLHRELDHDPLGRTKDKASELSFTDREIRRRTMWACFMMDRFNSSGTERPSFGNEEYMHIQLPIKESHFQLGIPGATESLDGETPTPISPGLGQISDPQQNMGVASYVIRAVAIWGRIVKYLNLGGKEKDPQPLWSPHSHFAELRKQTETLQHSLPSFLEFNQENLQNHAAERVANQFLYLHIIIQQVILFLNRFAIPVSPGVRPPKDMPKQFLADSGQIVVKAANQISTLIELSAPHSLTVPFAGYCAYASSTVQIWGIFSKNPQLEATSKENLRHNYKYLNKMKNYWGMFHYMAESVKQIYKSFADASRQPEQTKSGDETSPMFQYGDWFDKYPLGVPRADFEEMDHDIKREPGTEAVMSKQSDLQSVEEFFASLSPPSKAESTRKVAKKHNKNAGQTPSRKATGNVKQQGPDPSRSSHQARRSFSVANEHPMALDTNLSNFPPPSTQLSDNTPTTLFSAQTPQSAHQQTPFNTAFDFLPNSYQHSYPANQVNQLDRQLVFASYAGIDANNHPGLNNFNNTNYWENLDLNGYGAGGGSGGGAGGGGYGGMSGAGGFNEASSAWFTPFNLQPPMPEQDASGGSGGFGGMDLGGIGGNTDFAMAVDGFAGHHHHHPASNTAARQGRSQEDLGMPDGGSAGGNG